MALQYSDGIRNAQLDQVQTVTGVSGATLEIRTLTAPANCAAADVGTVLATIALPNPWMAAAAGGSKAKTGTWQDTSADATGTAGHFRIKQGATCHVQGTVGTSGTDMVVDNVSFSAGQSFTVVTFTINAGNG
jgi:hypothetical protein